MEAKAIAPGHDPGMADATMAGIANAHDLVIVTLKTRHFLPIGVPSLLRWARMSAACRASASCNGAMARVPAAAMNRAIFRSFSARRRLIAAPYISS